MNYRNPLFLKHAGQSLSTVLCFILPKMNLVLLVATALLLLTADFHRDLLVRLCVVGRPGCSSYFESSRWTRIKFSSVGERGVWCLSCCLAAVIVSVVVVYTMLICYLWYWNVATCLNNSEYAYLCGT